MEEAEQRLYRERVQKIRQYETFINEQLKVDLQKTLERRERIYEMIAKYLELKNTIIALQENGVKEMKTLVNLGSEFYAHAKVPDTSRIFVLVGLGFHVEFTLPEALQFIDRKEEHLTKQAETLSQKAAAIKSKIKIFYEGINQLLALPEPRSRSTG